MVANCGMRTLYLVNLNPIDPHITAVVANSVLRIDMATATQLHLTLQQTPDQTFPL